MKKLIVIILTLFLFSNCYSQEEQKSKFSIKVGTEYRITPIYSIIEEPTLSFGVDAVDFNLDKQLSGTSINYTLSYILFKKFEIGFSHSFRFDHVYYKSGLDALQPNTNLTVTQGESINRWITDYHFFVGKYFTLKKTDVFLKVGYSMMNRGTDYRLVFSHDFGDNEFVYISSPSHFNFSAFKVSTGFVSNKFEFSLGAYFVGEFEKGALIRQLDNGVTSESQVQQNIILPFLKLTYRIK